MQEPHNRAERAEMAISQERDGLVRRLAREKKIIITDQNEQVAGAYKEKSKNSLRAGRFLKDQGLFEEATSMIYYAMYHKALSLFFLVGIKCENHTATAIVMKDIFGFRERRLDFAKDERIKKQYYTSEESNEQQVDKLLLIAEDFLDEIKMFINELTQDKIIQYRNAFKERYLQSGTMKSVGKSE